MWDKNRPSRIIPRAEVHTTQDITVEELKPPTTDADDAARPTSARRPKPDRASHVLLAVDVGNTQTVLGLYRGREIDAHEWRITTDRAAHRRRARRASSPRLLARRGLARASSTAVALSTDRADA